MTGKWLTYRQIISMFQINLYPVYLLNLLEKSLQFVTKKHSLHIGRATKIKKFQYYICRLKNKGHNAVSKQNLDTYVRGMSFQRETKQLGE
jgi:hypothetical protein